ncbi:MAG: hypothetical protein OXH79_09515 [Boseongicola sp.]|nr:hypothetical protein [Boseongicola sp.]
MAWKLEAGENGLSESEPLAIPSSPMYRVPMRFLILLFLLLSGAVHAQDRYFGLVVGSLHVGNDNLNNFNPGLSYGKRWGRRLGTEWHLEGGVFHNSYDEVSPFVLVGVSTHLITLGRAEIRGGVGTGIGYYRTLAEDLKDDYGIPNIGGYLPLATATLSARFGGTDFRLTTVPPDRDTTAIFNFSIARRF